MKQETALRNPEQKDLRTAIHGAVVDTLEIVLAQSAHNVEMSCTMIADHFVELSAVTERQKALTEQIVDHFNNFSLEGEKATFDQFLIFMYSSLTLAVEKNMLLSHLATQACAGIGALEKRLDEMARAARGNGAIDALSIIDTAEKARELQKVMETFQQLSLNDEEKRECMRDLAVVEKLVQEGPARQRDFRKAVADAEECANSINHICGHTVTLLQFQDKNTQAIDNIRSIVARHYALFMKDEAQDAGNMADEEKARLLLDEARMSDIRNIFGEKLGLETGVEQVSAANTADSDNIEFF